MKGRRSLLQLIMEGLVLLEMAVAVDYEGKPMMTKRKSGTATDKIKK